MSSIPSAHLDSSSKEQKITPRKNPYISENGTL